MVFEKRATKTQHEKKSNMFQVCYYLTIDDSNKIKTNLSIEELVGIG